MTCSSVLVYAMIVLVSYILTSIMRKYSLANGVMDIPNGRSSHTVPTPRGGGLSIVALSLLSVLLLVAGQSLPIKTGLAFLLGGSSVALVGWIDDKYDLGACVRFAVHVASSVWTLMMLGGLPSISIGTTTLASPVILSVLAAVGVVWSINLFNFMDGIDGIAGVQTVCVGFGGGFLLLLSGEIGLARCMFALGAAALGFLVLNWHPAKIFMGDVGSGFVGYYVAAVAIASENASEVPILLWVVLMAVFAVDATATLVYRTINRYPWAEAHRTHVYQLAVQNGLSHNRVSIIVGIVDATLVAIAYLGLRQPEHVAVIARVTLAAVFIAWLLLRRRLRMRLTNMQSR